MDTNVLLVFLIGTYNRNILKSFKRTAKYSLDDLDAITAAIRWFEQIITTPHILTEISNLSMQLRQEERIGFFQWLTNVLEVFKERQRSAVDICSNRSFPVLGLTDTAIMDLAPGKYLVFTDDFPLANRLESLNVDVINYNHARFAGLSFLK